ncbi:hypothetical protein PR048_012930 [Dryococelus australis]|uniref:Transposase n=1 Tax=Dryococelus australis TaxID=614101 RepID=A0ABQ9HS77_9NEOP|nr:hypothetical protein PR048_012930 [Dryococelus australis]
MVRETGRRMAMYFTFICRRRNTQERTMRSIILIHMKYFSKHERIVRMIGWILCFVNNCHSERLKRIGQLSSEEVGRAE